MCLNIKREEEKDMKEYEVNGEIRHKVFYEVTQK